MKEGKENETKKPKHAKTTQSKKVERNEEVAPVQNNNVESETKKNGTKKVLVATTLAGVIGLGVGFGVGFCVPKTTTTDKYTIEVASQQGVSISCDKDKGNEYTLVAKDVEGYNFVCWEHNGELITDKTYTFVVDETTEGTYTAIYEIQTFSVKAYVDGEEVVSETKDWGTSISSVLPSDVTSDNSCGWFLDAELTQKVNTEDLVKGDVNLYTKTATLDYLDFYEYSSSAEVSSLSTDKTYYVGIHYEAEEASVKSQDVTWDIVVPETYHGCNVVGIIDNGFSYTSISSITLPSSITTIGTNAFANSTVQTINFTDIHALTTIGEGAFQKTTELTSFSLPNTVTELGARAFYNSAIETFTIEDDSPLTELAESLFLGSKLETITYGANCKIELIDAYCFAGSNLKDADIPKSVKAIGSAAFAGTKITTLEFAKDSDLEEVYYEAFADCSNLKKITFTKNFTVISEPEGGDVASVSSYSYVFCGDMSSLTTIIIDGNVSIGAIFAECDAIERIIVKDGVTEFGLSGCISSQGVLVWVTLPESIQKVTALPYESLFVEYDGAMTTDKYLSIFGDCRVNDSFLNVGLLLYGDRFVLFNFDFNDLVDESTTVVEVPSGSTEGYMAALSTLYPNMEEVIIPSDVTSIADGTFYDCSNLMSVVFADDSKLTTIGGYAFGDCTSLTSITIPSSVTSIGQGAFYGCTSLETINIPENVTSIGDGTFYNCTSLTSITIPSSVTSIGEDAFYGCINLLEIFNLSDLEITAGSKDNGYVAYYAAGVYTSLDSESKLITRGDYLMYEDEENGKYYLVSYLGNDTKITLPTMDYTYEIKNYAFYGCTGLTSITIPSSATSIGDYAFNDCSNLRSITISTSITSIGDYAFNDCSNLTSVTFEEDSQLTTIGSYAFYNCSSLISITIPISVTTIGKSAFQNCKNLRYVVFKDSTSQWRVNNTTIVLNSSSTNATNLRVKYCDYTWTKLSEV